MEEKAAKGRLFQAMSYLGGELASSESARYRFIAAIHLGFDKLPLQYQSFDVVRQIDAPHALL